MAIYCFSDLHGRYELWDKIKKYIKKDDIVYCLGDCIDRGPGGYEILKEVLEHPQIKFLLGNHEDFLMRFVPEFIKGNMYDEPLWCDWNGGDVTWDRIQDAPVGEVQWIIQQLNKAPLHDEFKIGEKMIYLSHSGYNPWELNHEFLKGVKEKDIYTWDRVHLNSDWNYAKQIYSDMFDFDNSYIIHGHTPVQKWTGWKDDYIANPELYDPKVRTYCDGHKIDIDLCSVESDKAVLFNLDTFEEIYFKCENEPKKLDW